MDIWLLLESNASIKFEPDLNALWNLFHRGPDDKDIYLSSDQKVGLAHSRFSIIDVSKNGHQPMQSSDRKLTIVFNGEIYNYKESRIFYTKMDRRRMEILILQLF